MYDVYSILGRDHDDSKTSYYILVYILSSYIWRVAGDSVCSCFPGSGRNKSGVYYVQRQMQHSPLWSVLFCHHALLPLALHNVWKRTERAGKDQQVIAVMERVQTGRQAGES